MATSHKGNKGHKGKAYPKLNVATVVQRISGASMLIFTVLHILTAVGVMHTPMIQSGINVNMYNESGVNRDGGVLDFCRLNDITIQPWSPMQYGFFKGCFIDNEKFPELNKVLENIGNKYGVSKTTMAFAWILRHPAKMQPITGTTNITRLTDCLKASEVEITREEWYEIYRAAGNILP
jgi:predicted oxidoreductase